MRKHLLKICLLGLLLLFAAALPCYAAVYAETLLDENDLQVNKGSGAAMSLVYSSVTDGESAVAPNAVFELEFSKNVVNFSVLGHNRQCFHLLDAEGEAVEIKLIFPDDQVQKQYKRQVFIEPTAELRHNSRYTLIVDNDLISKNGAEIDNAYIISFTTREENSAKKNRILAELGDDVLEYTQQSGKREASQPVYRPLLTEEPAGEPDYGIFKTALAILALLLAAAALLLKKRTAD